MKVSVFFLAHFLEEQQEKQKEIHIQKRNQTETKKDLFNIVSFIK